ncbi:MAG: aminoglycoside phosphotransferase family protein [Phenylobacterium sp.]|uniref:aminoglycoside phosphotransferase family protein n=1 Tax=Phenylobacterium sp. TaxID=1871053 RepID=UPI002733A96A|nr:aminoglycoside phosphotransferase family protein [Phenylobacterium sp.]MDP3173984.1 aminoglycoside phosphotransferase family protein [Phenylobacterium sp.]
MLKIAMAPQEIRGAAVMVWWAGDGAARVLAHDGPALLLERAVSPDGVVAMARDGRDDEALSRLCDAVAALHRPRPDPPAGLQALRTRFEDLAAMAGDDPRLEKGHRVAQTLLADPRDAVVLHGDVHHANVLDFGPRGWLAIDPNGLIGERAYDYANIFRNPDAETALAPGRLERRLASVCAHAGLEPARMKGWIIAHAALSTAWFIEDGRDPAWSFAVLEVALKDL